jgi:hypothetical protein
MKKRKALIIGTIAFLLVTCDLLLMFTFQQLAIKIFDIQNIKDLMGLSIIILISFGWGIAAVFIIQYLKRKLKI